MREEEAAEVSMCFILVSLIRPLATAVVGGSDHPTCRGDRVQGPSEVSRRLSEEEARSVASRLIGWTMTVSSTFERKKGKKKGVEVPVKGPAVKGGPWRIARSAGGEGWGRRASDLAWGAKGNHD